MNSLTIFVIFSAIFAGLANGNVAPAGCLLPPPLRIPITSLICAPAAARAQKCFGTAPGVICPFGPPCLAAPNCDNCSYTCIVAAITPLAVCPTNCNDYSKNCCAK